MKVHQLSNLQSLVLVGLAVIAAIIATATLNVSAIGPDGLILFDTSHNYLGPKDWGYDQLLVTTIGLIIATRQIKGEPKKQ